MVLCYLGLGSNLKSPQRQLRQAIKTLRSLPRSVIKEVSDIFLNPAIGMHAGPKCCNMVVCIQTTLPISRLHQFCKQTEENQGRIRKGHWKPRVIDIDLLLYGNQIIHTNKLSIPHPEMLQRDFVLIPLLEISPDAKMPDGIPISNYLHRLKEHGQKPDFQTIINSSEESLLSVIN